MGRRATPPHLYLRGRTYYFRIAVPQKLVSIFKRGLYKKSLGTGDYRTAVRLCQHYSIFAERYFSFVNMMRPGPEDIHFLIRNHFEKCLIKVTLNWNMIMTGVLADAEKRYCMVTICNIGRRPIYLSHAHIKVPSEKYSVLFPEGLNGVTLAEGAKPHMLTAEQGQLELDKLKKAWWRVRASVIDAAGREYNSEWLTVAPKWAEDVKAPLGAVQWNKIKNWVRKRLP